MSGTSPPPQPSSTAVDLHGDSSLQVEISDAVSERDKVKFTVQTKVRLQGAQGGLEGCRCRFQELPSASAHLGVVGRCQRSLWALFPNLAPAPCPSEKAGILSLIAFA